MFLCSVRGSISIYYAQNNISCKCSEYYIWLDSSLPLTLKIFIFLSHFQDKNSRECEGRGREDSPDWRGRGQSGGGRGPGRGREDADEGLGLQAVRGRRHPLPGAGGPPTGQSHNHGLELGAKVLTRKQSLLNEKEGQELLTLQPLSICKPNDAIYYHDVMSDDLGLDFYHPSESERPKKILAR